MNFEEHLLKYLTLNEINSILDSFNEKSTSALLLNTEKMLVNDFLVEFPNITPHLIVPNVFLYDKNEIEFGKHIYHDLGVYYLFEPCSSLVSYFLNPKSDDLLLDIAAAPGGKSIHASLLMKNNGLIISNEISNSRAQILSSNIERMGRKNVVVTSNNVDLLAKKYKETFNKIILDAPCSGSGMFRKESKMKDDWTYEKVLRCQKIQQELILQAASMLKAGGEMIYSTCSFSYEEDEEVIKYLLEQDETMEIVPLLESDLFYQSDLKGTIHLFPYLFPGEGHYIAKLRKKGDLLPTKIVYKQNSKFKNYLINLPIKEYIYQNNSILYSLPYDFDLKGLYLIRGGLKIGEIKKDFFHYDHHLSHVLITYFNSVDLNIDEVKLFMHGELLSKPCQDGFVLVTYKNIGIGWGKAKDNKIKNHYPKGLRK